MIARLIREKLVDYFAMDIKHTWGKYPSLVGVPFEKEKYEKSIELIIDEVKDYEFRSTVIE
jgi:pyruvate formate lyase activating enzyme